MLWVHIGIDIGLLSDVSDEWNTVVLQVYVILSPGALQEAKTSNNDSFTRVENHIGIRSLTQRRADLMTMFLQSQYN